MFHTPPPPRRRLITRYLLGDDILGDRTSDATFFRSDVTSVTKSRWARSAGWKRSLARVTAPPAIGLAAVDAHTDPHLWTAGAGAAGTALALRAGAGLRHRRFRRTYVEPLTAVLRRALPDAQVSVPREFAGLQARLVRPMSPAEESVRRWFGAHVEPVIRWAPERAMRAYWWAHGETESIRKPLDWFRKPVEIAPMAVEITIPSGFVSDDQRKIIRQAVVAKLGLSDLIETCDQVGPTATIRFVVRERPPAVVGLDDITPYLDACTEWEFVVGLTTGGRPVVISLDDDAPHIACSAGSGAGKSVLAKVVAAQVLRKGGRVWILDRKGSHRWARGLAGVVYCTTPAEIHDAWIYLSQVADERNAAALNQPEGWVPGQREFIIAEELNATMAQLRMWWDDNRPKGGPKISPAITGFRNVMFMGRSAWVNIFGVAQMLTAQTTGGPEARENFGARFLARFTANNWRMLAPECAMPRKSKIRGRWYVVIAGDATEVQVAYLSDDQARELSSVPMSPNSDNPVHQGKRMGTTPDGDNAELLTLQEAGNRFCPGVSLETLKKRRLRARAQGAGPRSARTRGRAELYDPAEIRRWLTVESLTETESTNV